MSLPGNTFAQGHGWDGFAALASEETWAIVFACIGLLSGAWIGSPFAYARFLSVVLITSAHGSIALMMLRAAPVGSGAGTYGILAGLGYYLLWRQVRGEN